MWNRGSILHFLIQPALPVPKKKKKKLSNQNPTKMQGFYAKRDSSLLHSPIISSISDPSEVPKSTCSPAVAKLYSDGGNPLLLYSFLICSSCFRPRDEPPPPPPWKRQQKIGDCRCEKRVVIKNRSFFFLR